MSAAAVLAAVGVRGVRARFCFPSLFCAGILCAGCQTSVTATDAAQGRSLAATDRAIGWLHGSCLAIENDALAQGTRLDVVVLGEPQRVETARVVGPTTSFEQCHALIEGRRSVNVAAGYSFYALESSGDIELDMSIALVAGDVGIAVAEELARADVNEDGVDDYFTACSTSEGVRFSVKSGRPGDGEALWSGYYFLDYDLEPTCE